MRVVGDNENNLSDTYSVSNINDVYQEEHKASNEKQIYQQQQQPKESIGALLAMFMVSKGGKILNFVVMLVVIILFRIAPILAGALIVGYLLIIAIINFLTGKIKLRQLIVCIIGALIFIFMGFMVIIS